MIPAAPVVPALASVSMGNLVTAFLAGRKATTIAAYSADLADFAAFVGVETVDAAAGVLLNQAHGAANAMALAYRANMIERGLSPATVNRRLAALRSLVKLARVVGMVAWTLEVEGVKGESYRDTRGPGRPAFDAMLAEAIERGDEKGIRDVAILRLLHDLGLRRAELVELDREHVDLAAGTPTVSILGKGRRERQSLTLPPPTVRALAAWIEARGDHDGPLFVALDNSAKGKRLAGNGLWRIVKAYGDAVGVDARPHGIRHTAITEALDATNGNVRAVQKFSRHRSVAILERYDDNRTDMGGQIAAKIAE